MKAIGNYCLCLIKIAIYNYSVLIPTLYEYDNSDLQLWSRRNAGFETAFHRVCFHHELFSGIVANGYVSCQKTSSSACLCLFHLFLIVLLRGGEETANSCERLHPIFKRQRLILQNCFMKMYMDMPK